MAAPPAFWITNAFDRSPAELLRVQSRKWSPLDGGLLELSYGEGRLHLVLTEPVTSRNGRAGVVQGGMVASPIPDLPTGIMRGRFNPSDEQFYACGLYSAVATEPGNWTVRAWNLLRSQNYGSDHFDERVLTVTAATMMRDGRGTSLVIPDFEPTWCYSVEWNVTTAAGTRLRGRLHGTLHHAP